MDIRTLVKAHELCVEDDLTRKADFVLAYSSYSLRRARKDHRAEYDVLGSNCMMEIVTVLGRVVRPRAQRDVFCSPLQFSLVQGPCFIKRKSGPIPGNNPASVGLRARRAGV